MYYSLTCGFPTLSNNALYSLIAVNPIFGSHKEDASSGNDRHYHDSCI